MVRKNRYLEEKEREMHENYKIMLQRGVGKLFVMSFGRKNYKWKNYGRIKVFYFFKIPFFTKHPSSHIAS
jgi:hypothetical protein